MENSDAISFMRYDHDDLLDRKFKAIADDTRRKIIVLLSDHPMNAGEIASHFTISHASISYHLQKLEQSSFVMSRRSGQYIQYRLNKEALDEIYLWLENLTLENVQSKPNGGECMGN